MTAESGAAAGSSRAIFISYRRDDSEGEAGRLYDDLVRAYGDTSVFMDVAGIDPGVDFRQAIDKNVSGCGVLLAVIGPTWATIAGHDGTRRLDNPEDYVRLEISSALKRGIPVIPVLVHDARMPALDQLPEDLKDLRYRNSVELTHARWNSDVTLLIGALKNYVHVNLASETQPVHATVSVQLPAPQGAKSEPAKGSKLPLMLGLGGLSVALVVLLALLWVRSRQPSPGLQGEPPETQSQPQPAVTQPAAAQPSATSGAATASPAAATPAGSSAAPSPQAGAGSPAASGTALPPAPSAFLGQWRTAEAVPGADPVDRLSISDVQGQIVVQLWGRCEMKGECDWGSRPAAMRGSDLVTGAWQVRNSRQEIENKRTVILTLTLAGDSLQALVRNQTQSPDGQIINGHRQVQFVRAQ
jgi:hypothetical protein